MTVTTVEELAERLDTEIASSSLARRPLLNDARAAANETGIRESRNDQRKAISALHEARRSYDTATDALRGAQAAEREVTEEHAQALRGVSWRLEDAVEVEGAKRFLTIEGDRRQLTAEQIRDRVAASAADDVAVKAAAIALGVAEATTTRCRDAVDSADRAYAVAKRVLDACGRDVEAAIAELATLRTALPLEGPNRKEPS